MGILLVFVSAHGFDLCHDVVEPIVRSAVLLSALVPAHATGMPTQ